MRLSRVTVLAVCALALVAGTAAACGGGSSGTKRLDTSKVPTATLPATLPEPKLVGSGAVQSGGATSYTVKSGDTLAGIAERFGVSLDDLRAANPNINSSSLSIGQSVRLPAASDAPPAAPTKDAAPTTAAATATEAAPADTPVPAATATPVSVGQTYTVVEGDIPVTIAEKFGITVEELLAANPRLDPTALRIGQVLIIPPKRQP